MQCQVVAKLDPGSSADGCGVCTVPSGHSHPAEGGHLLPATSSYHDGSHSGADGFVTGAACSTQSGSCSQKNLSSVS